MKYLEISQSNFEAFEAAQALAHAFDICGPDSPQVAARLAAWRAANAAWRSPLDTNAANGQTSNHE